MRLPVRVVGYLIAAVLFPTFLFAQWLPAGASGTTPIYYAGPVGVGTSAAPPAGFSLDVTGATRFGGSVFMGTTSVGVKTFYLWPDSSGPYLLGTGSGVELVGGQGTIRLSNADTVVQGFGTTAFTAKGSDSTATRAAANFTNLAGNSLMYVRNDGNVGIGQTSPSKKLDVNGGAKIGTDLFVGTTLANYSGNILDSYGSGENSNFSFTWAGSGGGYVGAIQNLDATAGYRNGLLIKTSATDALSKILALDSGTASRFVVKSDGTVGINQPSPAKTLDVNGTFNVTGSATFGPYLSNTAGNILDLGGTGTAGVLWSVSTGGYVAAFQNLDTTAQYRDGLLVKLAGASGQSKAFTVDTGTANRFVVLGNGNVGINNVAPNYALDVTGNANFTGTVTGGNIQAKYQDVAEWVPAAGTLPAGTVVVLNRDHDNEVTASSKAYDTAVAGVVSTQPGLILGEGSASKAMIATTGRVKVHVDASRHPVAIGDLLVTGDKPGTAMLSEPMDINGRRFHQPGTIIGKALQPLNAGEGEILVLLSLQ
jgi:hypothetical protein